MQIAASFIIIQADNTIKTLHSTKNQNKLV